MAAARLNIAVSNDAVRRAGASGNSSAETQSQILAVERALLATGRAALRSIKVDIRQDSVVLRGCVPTYFEKQMAQATVQQIEGVQNIANEIEVACSR
jgi:osmotically-inducible protein OsmY